MRWNICFAFHLKITYLGSKEQVVENIHMCAFLGHPEVPGFIYHLSEVPTYMTFVLHKV